MEWFWLVAGISFLATMTLALLLPRRLVPRDLPPADVERRKLQLEMVKTFAEALGGAFVLVTLLLAWQQVVSTQDQLEIARQGQITERFTRAVDQVGSDDVTVRVGGIYALESIARDSRQDRKAIMEILASFLRQKSPVVDTPDTRDWQAARSQMAPADVEAAAIVIGRRNREDEIKSDSVCSSLNSPDSVCTLSLRRVNLSSINLNDMDFSQMDLRGARFNHSNIPFGSFRNSNMQGADFRGANLRLAEVTNASFLNSYLELANLHLVEGLTCQQLQSSHDHGAGAANLTIRCP